MEAPEEQALWVTIQPRTLVGYDDQHIFWDPQHRIQERTMSVTHKLRKHWDGEGGRKRKKGRKEGREEAGGDFPLLL